MKKILLIALAVLLVLSFPFIASAQITKDQYYARSTLEGNELEFYDYTYDTIQSGINTVHPEKYDISDSRADKIINYVWGDAPELFRRSDLYTDEEAAEYQKQIDQKTDEILNLLTEDMTDYEKVKTIYTWLAENMEYGVSEEAGDEGQTIVGALVYGEAECGGISRALQYLLYKVDIPCYLVDGIRTDTGGAHGWNIIQIDGQWYNADLTDDLGYPNSVFLYGDSIFAGSHIPDPELNPPLPECPENYEEPTPTATPTPEPTATPAPVVANVEPQEPPSDGGNYTGWMIAIAAIGAIVAGITARNRHKKRT